MTYQEVRVSSEPTISENACKSRIDSALIRNLQRSDQPDLPRLPQLRSASLRVKDWVRAAFLIVQEVPPYVRWLSRGGHRKVVSTDESGRAHAANLPTKDGILAPNIDRSSSEPRRDQEHDVIQTIDTISIAQEALIVVLSMRQLDYPAL